MDRNELITALQQTATQKPKSVFVKGWGTVFIRALTVAEVNLQVELQQGEDVKVIGEDGKEVIKRIDKNRLARSAARVMCDEQGNRLLDPDNPEDVALLAKQPWAMLRRVLNASDDMQEEEKSAAGN